LNGPDLTEAIFSSHGAGFLFAEFFKPRFLGLPFDMHAAMGIVKRAVVFSSFVFLSLKVSLVFFGFWLRFLFFGSLFLTLLQSAIRTRTVSVPYDDSKSVKRNEAHPIYKTGSAS
jgi:hypothetical protein